MGLIPMTIWKMIEVLLSFSRIWNRLKKGFEICTEPDPQSLCLFTFEPDPRVERRRKTVDSSFQGKWGFAR